MYINTVQLASCHLHGDTCNKNNIDMIVITLLEQKSMVHHRKYPLFDL